MDGNTHQTMKMMTMMNTKTESSFLRHQSCDNCGSKDNVAVYDDGHTWCFGCNTYTKGDRIVNPQPEKGMTFIHGEIQHLSKRKITEDTCRKWDYQVGDYNGRKVQIANYKDSTGSVVAQKLRMSNKQFLFIGDASKVTLFGSHLWAEGGKRAVITEGEIDAMSVSQALGNQWPVFSVPTGASGASNAIRKSIEMLSKFDEVVIAFDNDEAGQKASKECASLLPPGKAKIANLPMKDANEMLIAGQVKEITTCLWQAKPFRPDGIIQGSELWDLVSSQDVASSCKYPFDGMNQKTLGIRRGEIVTFCAGSGIGKSQICREIAYHLLLQGETVGYVALEEAVKRSALGFMSLAINQPLHLSDQEIDAEQFKSAFDDTLGTQRVFFYDHWGSLDGDNLINKIRYMARGCGCNYVVLDHISIVVSGMEGGDERRMIDNTMTKLRALAEEVNVGILMVSHLKRPQGNRGHEDGAKTSMAQLRGSAGIGQLSDIVIGCERDQQSENPNTTTVRVLKNRWTGETGIACYLEYDKDTGRMTETEQPQEINFDDDKDESKIEDF